MITKIVRQSDWIWRINSNVYNMDELSYYSSEKLVQKLENTIIPDQERKIEELQIAMQNSLNKLYAMREMRDQAKDRMHLTAPVIELYHTKYPDIKPIKVPGTVAMGLIKSGFWSLRPERVSAFVYNSEEILEEI